jgi:hypothetical protein
LEKKTSIEGEEKSNGSPRRSGVENFKRILM